MYGVEDGSGLTVLMRWLARPYDPERVASALLGRRGRSARHLVATVIASSDEAEELLGAMPWIVRSLAIATTDRPERCYGELRGPVLWGETMSARSASAGDPGLFVCATTTKAYDTDENRVLKAALDVISRAGRNVELGAPGSDDAVARRARHNGQQAARLLEHQTLAQVPVTKPTGRTLHRTRAGSRRHTYRAPLAVLQHAGDPLRPEHLEAFIDDRTRAQHDLLAAVLEHVEDVTGAAHRLRSDRGGLTAGPVTYHHPGRAGDPGHVDGILIGDVLIDVPDPSGQDLATRAGDRRAVVAREPQDVERAVALALG